MHFAPLTTVVTVWFVLFSSHPRFVEGDHSATAMQQRRPPMAGGWTESKLDDPMVLEAADFLFRALIEERPPQYSFLQSITATKTTTTALQLPAVPVIIQASQQVVAGMNFQLTLLVQSSPSSSSSGGDCLGAFTGTVYNRFGDLTVTDWKDELSCAQAKIILEKRQARDPEGVDR
jgi:hypothetical protein